MQSRYKPDKSRTTLWLDPEVNNLLKTYATYRSLTLSDAGEEILKNALRVIRVTINHKPVQKKVKQLTYKDLSKVLAKALKESENNETVVIDSKEKLEKFFAKTRAEV
ncbi:MAG: hypothetical protein AAB437_04765 [Patescibacteria group bacterium]